MSAKSKIERVTGFSARQAATIAGLLALAVVMMPLGVHAAGTLFTLANGSNDSQQAVSVGQAHVGTVPGVPASPPVSGTVNLSAHTAQRLVAVFKERVAFSDLVVANGGEDEAFVSISTGVASSHSCTGTISSPRNAFSIAAPAGETVSVAPPEALVLPETVPTSSTTWTCIFATATQGSFVFISYVGYAADSGGIITL